MSNLTSSSFAAGHPGEPRVGPGRSMNLASGGGRDDRRSLRRPSPVRNGSMTRPSPSPFSSRPVRPNALRGGRSGRAPSAIGRTHRTTLAPSTASMWLPACPRKTRRCSGGTDGAGDDRFKLRGRCGGQHHRLARLQLQADGLRRAAAIAEQQLLERRIHRGLAKQDLDAAGYWADLLAAAGRPAAYDRGADRFLLGRAVGSGIADPTCLPVATWPGS